MLFRTYLHLVLEKPFQVLGAVACLVLFLAWHSQHFRLDASADSLVVEGDADLAFAREINARYGAGDFIFITFSPVAQDLFTADSLAILRNLKTELEAVNGVSSIDSIFDVPLFKAAGASLSDAGDNILTLESPEVELAAARADLRSSEAYRNVLISEDGGATALIVNFRHNPELAELLRRREELRELARAGEISEAQKTELEQVEDRYGDLQAETARLLHEDISQIREIIQTYRDAAVIYLGGVPMIADDLIAFVRSDLINFGLAILAFIIASLAYLFRKPRYVCVPLLCGGAIVLSMIGLLGLLDWPVTIISSNFVSLLLIISISLTVHLIVRYRELEAHKPGDAHGERLRATLGGMLRPCAYASLTTIAAFGSLVVSDIPPIIDFGWMMVLGVCCAFLLAFLIFPAALARLPASPSGAGRKSIDITPALGRFTDRHGRLIFAAALLLFAFSIGGMSRLKVENSFINYFDEETDIYQGMVAIDRNMGGTTPLDIIIDLEGPAPEGDENASETFWDEDEFAYEEEQGSQDAYWFTSDKMQLLIDIHDYLEALPETGKVLSLATLIKIAQELNGGEALNSIELAVLYNRIPEEYKESLLRPYVSVAENQVRFSLRVIESSPDLVRGDLLAEIRSGLTEGFGFSHEQVRLTGMLVLYNNMLQSLFDSQIMTLALVLTVIMLMFFALFRSLSLAVIGIIPNVLAAATVLGLMGWLSIPLDMMTITIAAISVGIGVDNTIHYIHRFRTSLPAIGDYRQTMLYCHGSIGKAMYYTSFTIVVGFSVLVLSNFIPTIYFGLLTGLAMCLALTGALTLLPQLLITFKPLKVD